MLGSTAVSVYTVGSALTIALGCTLSIALILLNRTLGLNEFEFTVQFI